MKFRALIAALSVALGAAASPPSVEFYGAGTTAGADSPEGVWRIGDAGAVFEVRPLAGSEDSFELYLLSSPDLSIVPGSFFGTMTSTGTRHVYEARLRLDSSARTSSKNHSFIFTLSDDATRLKMRHYVRGKQVSFYRWASYLFRVGIHNVDSRPSDVDAAVRISPTVNQQHIII